MNAKEINEAILLGVEVEVWRDFRPLFGADDDRELELMGSGRIVRKTKTDIILDNGMRYPLEGSEIHIK